MVRSWAGAVAAVLLAVPGQASAEVKASAADGLSLEFKGELAMPRDAAFQRVVAVGSWWSDAHTYSGKASAMTIVPAAGGCWCETWSGGEVEHGRVIAVMTNQILRLQSALGPLQGTGVNGALTFTLADGPQPMTTSITLTYEVVGSSLSNLTAMAAPVDMVMKEQFDRLIAGKQP
jgi:hypothetical protein